LRVASHDRFCGCPRQAENCFGTWLYTYCLQGADLGPAVAGNAVSLFWGSFTAGRLLAIPASARLAPAAILLGSLPLAVLGPALALVGRGSALSVYAAAVAAGVGISTGATARMSSTRRLLVAPEQP
jgi:fucose permease